MAAEEGQRERPQSILVVSLDNLGDLVFASALFPPLRQHFPAAHIAVWCKEYSAGIAPLLPGVDAIYSADPFWDRSPGRGKGPASRFLSVAASVRRARFDTAILCFAPWRTAAAVAATGIPVRIGLERRRNHRWLTDALPAENRVKPVVEEVLRLLTPLGIRDVPCVISSMLLVSQTSSQQLPAPWAATTTLFFIPSREVRIGAFRSISGCPLPRSCHRQECPFSGLAAGGSWNVYAKEELRVRNGGTPTFCSTAT